MKFIKYINSNTDIFEITDHIEEGKEYVLTLDLVKSKRSDAQNRFYFGVLLPALVEYGKSWGTGIFEQWNKDDYHDAMKEKYLRSKSEKTGRIRTRSTTTLSVGEFSQYLETIIGEILITLFNGVILDRDKELYNTAMGIK